MACKINYNSDNKIVSVTGQNGQESTLFNALASHPMVENMEQALEMYKNIYSKELEENKETDYVLSHRTSEGEVVSRYKDALKSETPSLEIGLLDNSGNFHSLMTVKPSFDTDTRDGFINTYVREGILSENKALRNGESFLQPAGFSQAGRGVNDIFLQDALTTTLGWKRYEKTRNGYRLLPKESQKSDSRVDNILEKEIADVLKRRSQADNTQELNESELKLRLLGVLNKLGIKATSIAEYVKKYKVKNGVEPSAKALADIANKVVAFKNGEIGLEDLSEEVSHFIVEGWDQNEIENLLRNIHKTVEWAEHSERYREIYAKEYPQEELDEVVRREVLGKVLANSMTNNFSTEGKVGAQVSIIQRLQELFDGFVDYVRSIFSQQAENDLQRFTEKVNTLLFDDMLAQYLNVENIEKSKFRMYSVKGAQSSIKKAKINTLETLKIVSKDLNNLVKAKIPFSAQKTRIDRAIRELSEEQESLLKKQSVLELTAVVDSMVNHLNAVMEKSLKEGGNKFMFTTEENTTYQTLLKQILPLLGMVDTNIDANSAEYGKDWKEVKDQIREVTSKANDLKNAVGNSNPQVIDRLVEGIMVRHNLDEKYRNYVNAWLNSVQSDTSHMHRYFGQLVNSRDPLLGLASDIVERTFSGSNQESVPVLKTFQQRLKELGVDQKELKQLADQGYLLDVWDHAKIEEHLVETRAKIRKEVTGDTRSVEEISKLAREQKLDALTRDQSREFSEKYNAHKLALGEKFFTEEYYKEQEEKYKRLNVAPETVQLRKKYSADRNSLVQEALKEDGTIDYNLLSIESEERLKAITRERASDKSILDQTGVLKGGLSKVLAKGDENVQRQELLSQGHEQPVLVKGIWYFMDGAKAHSEEARTALDLIRLDQEYVKEIEGEKRLEGIPQAFKDQLKEVEDTQGKEAAKRFLDLNASVYFNEDFWSSFGNKDSFMERFKNSEYAEDYQQEIQTIQELNNERSDLLKKYRKLNNPHETEVSKMKAVVKDKIKELDAQLQGEYNFLSSVFKEEDASGEEANPQYKTEVNEAYLQEVQEQQMTVKEEIEFIKANSPTSTVDRIASFVRSLNRFTRDQNADLPPSHLRIIEAYYEQEKEPGSTRNLDEIIRFYARTQVASYYKRLVPNEFTDIFDRQDELSVSDYVAELEQSQFIDVRPNYSFYDNEDVAFKNPNYDPNFEGGVLQPRKGNITLPDGSTINFENERYKEMFRPDSQGKPTQNQKMFDALQELKNLQRQTLENYGIEGTHNLYKLPQINKKGVDRAMDFIKNISPSKIGQNLKELAVYRVDDVEFGETQGAVNKIPTYYTRDVENKDELTDELFYSYALMSQQAVLYKHRKNNLGDMLALQDAILKRDYPKGKAAESSVTMAMFKNYMEYAIFGIKESQELKMNVLGREVDLTKFARVLLNFVKFRNLGFSLIVPATSGLTQEVQYQIDQQVGEITNPQSARMATKEFGKLAYDAMKEMGKFSSESKLNVMGEFFGIYNLEDRFKSSNYGYLMRNLDNAGFMTHQMANFPITPRIMLAVLMDQRVVKGEIMNFNQYKKAQDPKLTLKEVTQNWKQFESEALYNYIEVDKVGVKFKDGLEGKIKDADKQAYLQQKMNAVTDQIKRNVSQFDAQITTSQRVAAQRNFALNFFMTHRGWMSIVTSNRTKALHRNVMSGELEEGSYVSFYNYLGDVARGMMNKKGLNAFRSAWNGEDIERKDVRRVDGEYITLDDYKNLHQGLPQNEVLANWANEEKVTRNEGISVEELTEVRRRNMRRVAIDTAWLTAIMAVSYLLMNWADDDKDNYALQLGNYLTLRVLNETSSAQFGLGKEMFQTLSSPIVGLNTIASMMQLPYDMITGSDEIKSGFYKGDTKRFRALTKVTPGMRTITDMQRIDQAAKNYWFYNNDTMSFSVPGLFYSAGLEK